MNNSIFKKNEPKWDHQEILNDVENFCEIYEKRPIKDNKGGMKFPHAFALFFILKKIRPDLVIESGIFKGQSTWLIENTLPNVELICLDIDLSNRVYVSKKAKYSNLDFKFHNFSKIPENTLVLFDDHVNHIERLKEANYFKIKNIILEDNYSANTGDFQTIKQCYQKYSFNHKITSISAIKTLYLFIKILLKKIITNNYSANKDLSLISNRIRDYGLNEDEFENINKIIYSYYEFPPIIPTNATTDKPLFEIKNKKIEKYLTELNVYNYLTYIKLK
tara:strand:+ start:506 stop:1336 length:831 start_codon:yes stop_codon:yes gene_type:complete